MIWNLYINKEHGPDWSPESWWIVCGVPRSNCCCVALQDKRQATRHLPHMAGPTTRQPAILYYTKRGKLNYYSWMAVPSVYLISKRMEHNQPGKLHGSAVYRIKHSWNCSSCCDNDVVIALSFQGHTCYCHMQYPLYSIPNTYTLFHVANIKNLFGVPRTLYKLFLLLYYVFSFSVLMSPLLCNVWLKICFGDRSITLLEDYICFCFWNIIKHWNLLY